MSISWILDTLPFSAFTIKGHSMEPTIRAGERVLIFQWAYLFSEPKEGEVVIFRKGSEYWVKRIKKIEEGIDVEGDNKGDSQKIGPIKREDIIGKVVNKK